MDLLMKAATVVAVAFATVSSFPSPAQPQQDQQQQQTTTPAQQNPPASATPTEPGEAGQPQSQAPAQVQPVRPAPEMQLQPVKGALVSNLDSKSAKQGDSVVLRTEETVKTANGTEIPEGSKLVGHVTNVEPRSDSQENSQIAIQFDHAQLKTGQDLPIQSVIQSLAPASGGTTGDNTSMPSPSAPGATGSATGGSTNPSAGDNGTNPPSSASSRPAPDSNATAQSGAAADQNANGGVPAPGTVVARTGNVAIRVTSIPGVLLANSVTGQPFVNASGLLLGARRDIHLDGGTKIVVAVVEASHPAGGGMNR